MARFTAEAVLNRLKTVLQSNYRVVGVCHIWTGPLFWTGYGNVGVRRPDGVSNRAHKAMWQIFVGEVPSGMKVLHRCDNPACVNLAHLWLGTSKDNTQDMLSKGRGRVGKTHSAESRAKISTGLRKAYLEKRR